MESRYTDRTDEAIKKEMLEELDDQTLKIAGTFINDSFGPSSIKLAEVYMELDYLNEKRDINNLTGEELDMYVEQKAGKQVVRRKATYSKGFVEATGNNGTTIPEGTLVTIGDNIYKVLEEATIVRGKARFNIESLVSGTIGNAMKQSDITLVEDINGIYGLSLLSDVDGGYEAERDESLIERYLLFIQKPPTSGNVYHYIHWAKQIEGVGDAKVIPLWAGKNTVKVVIMDSLMETASDELVKKVQDYIDPNQSGLGEGEAPIGAYCTIVSAKAKDIKVEVKLELEHNYNIKDIKKDIFDSINNYIRTLTFENKEVSYSKIGAAILFTQGVKDYKDLRVNEDVKNIQIANEETAVLREVIASE